MPDGIRSGPAEMNATLRLGPQSVVVNSTTQFTDWRVHGQPVSGQVNATCILHPDLQTWQAQGALQAALPGMTPNHVAANATISANATTISLDTLNVASPGVRCLALSGAMDEHLYLTSTLDLIDLSIPG